MQSAPYPDVPPDFGNYLAGLIDGEGCFSIWRGYRGSARKQTYACLFVLSLREDDSQILVEARTRTGLGGLQRRKPERRLRHSHPGTRWVVQSRAECRRLVELLDRYPLRAKKAGDFAIWREAVGVWEQTVRGGAAARGRNDPFWRQLELLKDTLESGRRFTQLEPVGTHLIAAEEEWAAEF